MRGHKHSGSQTDKRRGQQKPGDAKTTTKKEKKKLQKPAFNKLWQHKSNHKTKKCFYSEWMNKNRLKVLCPDNDATPIITHEEVEKKGVSNCFHSFVNISINPTYFNIFSTSAHTLSSPDWWSCHIVRQTDEGSSTKHIFLLVLINWKRNRSKEYICLSSVTSVYNVCLCSVGVGGHTDAVWTSVIFWMWGNIQRQKEPIYNMLSQRRQREDVRYNMTAALSVHKQTCVWKPGGGPEKHKSWSLLSDACIKARTEVQSDYLPSVHFLYPLFSEEINISL